MAHTQEVDYDYFISESGRRWQPSASEHSPLASEPSAVASAKPVLGTETLSIERRSCHDVQDANDAGACPQSEACSRSVSQLS
jgi:hypothetical protein